MFFSQNLYLLNIPICLLFVKVFIILLCQINLLQNIKKIILFVKLLFALKIFGSSMWLYVVRNLLWCTTYQFKLIYLCTQIWAVFKNYYVKYVFFFLDILVWLCYGLCQDNALKSETSFNMGFDIDLCVIFGPCHKDNVIVEHLY